MNCAGWPSSAIRLGSARTLAIAFDRSTSRNSENCAALKMPNSVAVEVGVADADEAKLVATGVTKPFRPDELCETGPATPATLAEAPITEARIELVRGSSQLTPSSRTAVRSSSATLTRSSTWRGPGTRTRLMIVKPGWKLDCVANPPRAAAPPMDIPIPIDIPPIPAPPAPPAPPDAPPPPIIAFPRLPVLA